MSDAFWGALIPGAVAVILSILGIAKMWLDNVALRKDVNAVHTIVNAQKTAMQKEVDGLRQLIMQSMTDDEAVPVAGVTKIDKTKAAAIADVVSALNPPVPAKVEKPTPTK